MNFEHFEFARLFLSDIAVNSITEFWKLFKTFENKRFKVEIHLASFLSVFIPWDSLNIFLGVRTMNSIPRCYK